jgi:DNA-binding transcriptional LysR family regulator
VQLVVRSTRALRLTTAGAGYADACAAVVALAEDAERDAGQAHQRAAGPIRVTAPVGLGASLLLPTVAGLRRTHPGVQVELLLDERVVDLVRDGVDLAVRAGAVQSTPSFIARPLFATETMLVASPDFVAAHRRPIDDAAFARLPCIARRRPDAWTIDGRAVAIDGALVVNTYEAARDAAMMGLGIAQVPFTIVVDDLEAGRLCVVAGPLRTIKFTALWPARRLPVRVRVFVDLLVRHAGGLTARVDAWSRRERSRASPR